MTYNDEQFKELIPYEAQFLKAQRSRYAINPGRPALTKITQVHRDATGYKLPTNLSCSSCILEILRTVGKAYFADKAEREEAAQAKLAALREEAAAEKPATAEETGQKSIETEMPNPNTRNIGRYDTNELHCY